MGVFAAQVPISLIEAIGWANFGGASLLASLSDASDGTYAVNNIAGNSSAGHRLQVGMAQPSLPAGAAIKKITPKIRTAQVSGTQRLGFRAYVPDPFGGADIYTTPAGLYIRPPISTITDFAGSAGGVYLGSGSYTPQYIVDNLRFIVTTNVDTNWALADDHRVYKVTVDIEYDEQPTITGLALTPAGANTLTSRPPVSYTFNDPEGSVQAARRVVVWTATDFADANCPKGAARTFVATDGSVRYAYTGTGTAVDATEVTSSTAWTPPVDLPNGVAFVYCVQVADTVGDQTRWSTVQATLNVTLNISLPATPTLTSATWNASQFRTDIVMRAFNNLLTADAADNEAGLAQSWVANFNASGGVSIQNTPTAFTGSFSRRWITGGVGATDSSVITESFPVKAGEAISAHGRVRSSAATRNMNLQLVYKNLAGGVVGSAVVGGTVAANNTAWTLATIVNSTVPATAVTAQLIANAISAGATESLYIDSVGVYPGTAVPGTWTRGGLVSSQRLVVERSVDSGVTWTAIPTHSGLSGGELIDGTAGQRVTAYDLAARDNIPAVYRLKTTHFDGTYSYSSLYSTTSGTVTPVIDRWLLRDPVDATALTLFAVQGDLQSETVEEMAVYDLLQFPEPGIVSANTVGRKHWPSVQVLLTGETALTTFETMRSKSRILVLQSDMDGVAYWVRLGARVGETLIRSTVRASAATRPCGLDVELWQCLGPVGQPAYVP